MSELINTSIYPVRDVLNILLKDKTTGKNIIWATDAYATNGSGFLDRSQITEDALNGSYSIKLQPRIEKELEEQRTRTRKKAEVFTPVWICNKMNNYCDEQWFERSNVFNVECSDNQWDVVDAKIIFPYDENKKKKTKDWKHYVDSKRLEITCGEAPYIVSRYDAASGNLIYPLFRRIGLLDRKLRVVNENAQTDEEWIKWSVRALQSCYGYEYQGDSLLIARINILLTFCDYYEERFKEKPDVKLLKSISHFIVWNFWQMDGLNDTVPLGKPIVEFEQHDLFEMFPEAMHVQDEAKTEEALPCRIYDWRADRSVYFRDCKK